MQAPILYSQLAMRDRLVEEPLAHTNALLNSGREEVAVSSGREILLWSQARQSAYLRIRTWVSDPGNARADAAGYQVSPVLHLECPTASIYFNSPTGFSYDLPQDALPAGPAVYGIKVARRAIPVASPDGDSVSYDEDHDDQIIIDLWPCGELPQYWLDLLADDNE